MGKFLIFGGIFILITGLLLYFKPGGGGFPWFLGKLPGDIRIQKEGFSLFIPVTTMLLLSALLTLIIHLINRFR